MMKEIGIKYYDKRRMHNINNYKNNNFFVRKKDASKKKYEKHNILYIK